MLIDFLVCWFVDCKIIELGKFIIELIGELGCDFINYDLNLLFKGFMLSDDKVFKLCLIVYVILFVKCLMG